MRSRRTLDRRAAGRPLRGAIEVPGDKSISHRAVILGALASGHSRVAGVNVGEDVAATAAMMRALGAEVVLDETKSQVEVEGKALHEPEIVLDAGNSGTALRTVLGVCAAIDGMAVLTGDASVRRRPMLRVVEPLRSMGATIDGRRGGELAPLVVHGGGLGGRRIDMQVASAQVTTAVLLAGLHADGTTTVVEAAPSRDHTERMLAAAGVEVTRAGRELSVTGGARPATLDFRVPGDLSAAMFLAVAAALVPGSDLTITGVGLNPTRTGALDVLRSMGADLDWSVTGESGGEPFGDLRVRAAGLHGVAISQDAVPGLIDEIPILAVAAAKATGTTEITGAAELRVKESDRISAVAAGLRALGADVEELADGLRIAGGAEFSRGEIDSRGDHRVAMAFAIAALVANDNVRVKGWSCVNTSFPDFLDVLASAQRRA
ncbi:MAG: 3-phosphoshikimate 1-carboxyvinyltransferase [Actinomycetota bacterium]